MALQMKHINHAAAGAVTALAIPSAWPLAVAYYAHAAYGVRNDASGAQPDASCGPTCQTFLTGLAYGMGYWTAYYIYQTYIM